MRLSRTCTRRATATVFSPPDFMALKKLVTLRSGVAAEYHRIAGMLIDDTGRVLEVHVQTYADEDVRREVEQDAGGVVRPKWVPLAVNPVRATGADFSALFGAGETPDYPDKPALYAWLKTLPEFAGAADV